MTPSTTNSAIAAAAWGIRSHYYTGPDAMAAQQCIADIIARHVEPIVRAVERERDLWKDAHGTHTEKVFDEMVKERDQALAKLAEVERERDALKAERDEGMAVLAGIGPITCRNGVQHPHHDGCLYCERDSALDRAEQSEALLREALEAIENLHGHGDFRNGNTDATGSVDEGSVRTFEFVQAITSRISAHLAPKETT